ncbi:hypothetical protein NDR87_03205 [Nocardia sp. CDC159]|uniref:Uncharacterized protein n=1 Tax=Nocardia pulmonis TaxID=2951408 RepID=A0A9X2E2L9_9NOCA|nr:MULTISPECIES: hypothetical protein [Nocardia]MCM6771978.1 hypothetical protein [Nocardia pulmonis]MCM6785364.1 hypothetical protein [Nocardia sp. CDC159]
MSQAVDAILLRLASAAGVRELVFPAADTGRTRMRTLISAVYQLPYAVIHDVTAVDVLTPACAEPLYPVIRRTGNWTQTMPTHIRTDVDIVGHDGTEPTWIDVVADLSATVVLEIDAGELDSFGIAPLGEFATLDEFRAKFRYIDLDAFMREHQLSTVDDLRRAFRYLLAEVRIAPPAAFDPTDPAASRRLKLRTGILIRETVDLTATLRDVRRLLAAQEPVVNEIRDGDFAEITSPIAPLVVFPTAAVSGGGPTQQQVIAFFAAQQILAVFV